MELVVAVAQINYLPTVKIPNRRSLHDINGDESPFLYGVGDDKLSEVHEEFRDFVDSRKETAIGEEIDGFQDKYMTALKGQITTVLESCAERNARIVVFPEYSIPKGLMGHCRELSNEHSIVIVAGTHMIEKDELKNHPLSDSLEAFFESDFELLSICPIFIPKKKPYVVSKQFSSRYDTQIGEINDHHRSSITVEFGDEKLKLGIAICKEFLPTLEGPDTFLRYQEILTPLQDADLICIVSLNKNYEAFLSETTRFFSQRSHGSRAFILYSNYSIFGNSYIQGPNEEKPNLALSESEQILFRKIRVGGGSGSSYAKPAPETEIVTLLPQTEFWEFFNTILDTIESEDAQAKLLGINLGNLPNSYRQVIELAQNHVRDKRRSINKDKLKAKITDSILPLPQGFSVSMQLATLFDLVRKYVDKILDVSWNPSNDKLTADLRRKLQLLRNHGTLSDQIQHDQVHFVSNKANHLEGSAMRPYVEGDYRRFLNLDNDAEHNFAIRVISTPSEDAGIAYQVRLVCQIIEFLGHQIIIEYFDLRIVTRITDFPDQQTITEIFLLFKIDKKYEGDIHYVSQELFAVINVRLPVVNIELVEINSPWFADYGRVRSAKSNLKINPRLKADSKTRFSFSGRGEVSSIIKILAELKGTNSYNIRIFRQGNHENCYLVDYYVHEKTGNGIRATATTSLPDLQDLQDATSTFRFDFPMFTPESEGGITAQFRAHIWVESSLDKVDLAIIAGAIGHEVAGIGRFEVNDQEDPNFFVSQQELFHLIRLPFGRIPGFGQKRRDFLYDAKKHAISESGLQLGYVDLVNGNNNVPYLWPDESRTRHLYTMGKTGTGKSYFFASMISHDILQGGGMMVIDPHGDLIDMVIGRIPESRRKDILLFNPSEPNYSPGFNIFEADYKNEAHKSFIVEQAVAIFIKLFGHEIFGPRIQHYFREGVLSLMKYRELRGEMATLMDISKLFVNKDFQMEVRNKIKDFGTSKEFWNMYEIQNDREKGEIIPYFQAKFSQFTSNYYIRNMIDQQHSFFKMADVLSEKKILLVNLSKGKIEELNARLIGMVLVSRLYYAIMERAENSQEERKLFTLYIDEFQNFASSTFSTMLSEARKFSLSIVLANQYLNQLKLHDPYQNNYEDSLIEAILGNVGTFVTFRVSDHDAKIMAPEMKIKNQQNNSNPMVELDNFEAIVSTLIAGKKSDPFKLKSKLWDGIENYDHSEFLRGQINVKYKRLSFETVSDSQTWDEPGGHYPKEKNSSNKRKKPKRPSFKNFDYPELIKRMQSDPKSLETVNKYIEIVEPIKPKISDQIWYKEYVSEFDFQGINLKLPDESRNKYAWHFLLQLCLSSFSSKTYFERVGEENLCEWRIEVKTPDQSIMKSVSELWFFQIERLFKIYVNEQMNLQIILAESRFHDKSGEERSSNEAQEIMRQRLIRIEQWNSRKRDLMQPKS